MMLWRVWVLVVNLQTGEIVKSAPIPLKGTNAVRLEQVRGVSCTVSAQEEFTGRVYRRLLMCDIPGMIGQVGVSSILYCPDGTTSWDTLRYKTKEYYVSISLIGDANCDE